MVQRYAILSVLAVPGRAVLTLSLLLLTRHHIRIWIHGDFPTIVVPVPVQSVIAPVTKIAQSQTTATYSFHIDLTLIITTQTDPNFLVINGITIVGHMELDHSQMKATMVQCYTPSHTPCAMALWAWNVRSECIQN